MWTWLVSTTDLRQQLRAEYTAGQRAEHALMLARLDPAFDGNIAQADLRVRERRAATARLKTRVDQYTSREAQLLRELDATPLTWLVSWWRQR